VRGIALSQLPETYTPALEPPGGRDAQRVVERLIKALRQARPGNVRQFFQIANQHMRWELNELARRLDEQTRAVAIPEDVAVDAESSASQLSPIALRIFQAIDDLPEEEREVFSLIRIQGMNRSEAAQVLGVSVPTIQRRLSRALLQLNQSVGDLRPLAAIGAHR
jgi:RNA polymerase sigma factor (sigma-70 family)